ncbi:DNA-binding domain-containing protein, partial [Alkalihalophilus lindianensis]
SLYDIQQSLSVLHTHAQKHESENFNRTSNYPIISAGKTILLELGIIGESGMKDLLDILVILAQLEKEGVRETPALKDLYKR